MWSAWLTLYEPVFPSPIADIFSTEKVGSMFATIIVVLPSPFTGGAAHLSHANKSEVFDCSENSAHQTTVLSWYTDVTHSIEPITSGYRLALSYNVYHTTNALRPSLPTTHSAVNALRHVLLSWKQANGSDVPRKVIYLLDHQYTQANKTGSALKGADAHKLGILQGLAKELGFQLGLASLKAQVTGYADDDEYTPRAYGVANFMEVEERELKIKDLTDVSKLFLSHCLLTHAHNLQLDGNLLKKKIDFEDEGIECIPREFTNAVENGEFDDENYEGYQGNVRIQICSQLQRLTSCTGSRHPRAMYVPSSPFHDHANIEHQGTSAPSSYYGR